MESFVQSFKDAHNELMEQTGWGDVLENMTAVVKSAPELARSIMHEVAHFRFAVNWREPFFKYLLTFHVLLFCLVLYLVWWRWQPARPRPAGVTRAMELATSRTEEKLSALSVVLVALSFGAYPLNLLGAKYGSKLFVEPGVNYFDDNVVFIAVVYWFPIVLLAGAVQLKLLFNVGRLMVTAKAEQMKAVKRQQEMSPATRNSTTADSVSADAEKGGDYHKKRK